VRGCAAALGAEDMRRVAAGLNTMANVRAQQVRAGGWQWLGGSGLVRKSRLMRFEWYQIQCGSGRIETVGEKKSGSCSGWGGSGLVRKSRLMRFEWYQIQCGSGRIETVGERKSGSCSGWGGSGLMRKSRLMRFEWYQIQCGSGRIETVGEKKVAVAVGGSGLIRKRILMRFEWCKIHRGSGSGWGGSGAGGYLPSDLRGMFWLLYLDFLYLFSCPDSKQTR
jgi:hypothetical protein